MRVNPRSVVAFFCVFFLTGCENIQKHLYRDYAAYPLIPNLTPSPSSGQSQANSNENYEEVKRIINFKKALAVDKIISSKCADESICSPTERNDVATGLIIASDNICIEHLKTVYGNEATYNLGFGTATSLFAGASTVAASTGAKTLFSAFALFSNAERSLVNETVYKTMLSTAISTKIKEVRKTSRATLIDNLDSKPINKYSFDRSIHDVLDYHNNCTFMNGLELALKEGTQDSEIKKRATLNQSLKLVQSDYDTRKRDIELGQKKIGKKNEDEIALQKLFTQDPQLDGLSKRITALNASLQKLETIPNQ